MVPEKSEFARIARAEFNFAWVAPGGAALAGKSTRYAGQVQ